MRELEASLEALRGAVREYGARARGELGHRMHSAHQGRGSGGAVARPTATVGAESMRAKLRSRLAALVRALTGGIKDLIGAEKHARRR